MNQTTTGCGNCLFYYNGICTKAETCYGYSYTWTSRGHKKEPISVKSPSIIYEDNNFIIEYYDTNLLSNNLPYDINWISVDDKDIRPRKGIPVLVTIRDDSGDGAPLVYTASGFYIDEENGWIIDNELVNFVTHWANYPRPCADVKGHRIERL